MITYNVEPSHSFYSYMFAAFLFIKYVCIINRSVLMLSSGGVALNLILSPFFGNKPICFIININT